MLSENRLFPENTVRITHSEFEEFRRLQVRYRWDWPAVFSTNSREIWPWVVYGRTREELRLNVRGLSIIVDRVTSEYLERRPEGGRFFIDEIGAYYKEAGRAVQFVWFWWG